MADNSAAPTGGSGKPSNADSGAASAPATGPGASVGSVGGNSDASGKARSDGKSGSRDPSKDGGAASRKPKSTRGRGRPAGSGNAKPASGAAKPSTGSGDRATGAPGQDAPKVHLTAGASKVALGQQICFAHAVLAARTGQPLLALAPEEGEQLAGAIIEVGKHLNIVVDPKTAAFVSLGMTAATIYGSRVIAFQMGRASQRQQMPAPSSIVPSDAPGSDGDVLNNAARASAGIAPSVVAGNANVQPQNPQAAAELARLRAAGRRAYDFSRAA